MIGSSPVSFVELGNYQLTEDIVQEDCRVLALYRSRHI
jgi:hypothetical protein